MKQVILTSDSHLSDLNEKKKANSNRIIEIFWKKVPELSLINPDNGDRLENINSMSHKKLKVKSVFSASPKIGTSTKM